MTEKTYLKNPYLREFKARIIKKQKIDDIYHIILNRTIFYPGQIGAQLGDKGTISGVEVVDVFEKQGSVIHVVKENISSKDVNLSLEWGKRFDYMQQHTGEHLLSACIYMLYNKQVLNFGMGRDYSYIDIDIENIKTQDIERIEKFSNNIIYSNFEVKSYNLDEEGLKKIHLRKTCNRKTDVRIVEIDNMDFLPCVGTHCSSTGEVGIIKIIDWGKYKNSTRIKFLCGNRALKDYNHKNMCINNICELLSQKDIDICKEIENVINQNTNLESEVIRLKQELKVYRHKKYEDEV